MWTNFCTLYALCLNCFWLQVPWSFKFSHLWRLHLLKLKQLKSKLYNPQNLVSVHLSKFRSPQIPQTHPDGNRRDTGTRKLVFFFFETTRTVQLCFHLEKSVHMCWAWYWVVRERDHSLKAELDFKTCEGVISSVCMCTNNTIQAEA